MKVGNSWNLGNVFFGEPPPGTPYITAGRGVAPAFTSAIVRVGAKDEYPHKDIVGNFRLCTTTTPVVTARLQMEIHQPEPHRTLSAWVALWRGDFTNALGKSPVWCAFDTDADDGLLALSLVTSGRDVWLLDTEIPLLLVGVLGSARPINSHGPA